MFEKKLVVSGGDKMALWKKKFKQHWEKREDKKVLDWKFFTWKEAVELNWKDQSHKDLVTQRFQPQVDKRKKKVEQPRSACVIQSGDKFLMIKQKYRDEEFWSLPGGRQGENERPEQAVVRKMREELGISLKESKIEYESNKVKTN